MFLKKFYRLTYLISLCFLLSNCSDSANKNTNYHDYISELLAAEQKQITNYHNRFFSTPQEELRLRKTQVFEPLFLPDTVAFDSNVWRKALWEQYQVKLDSTQAFEYQNLALKGCTHEKLHLLHIPPQKGKSKIHQQMIWNEDGRLIFESESIAFELFKLNKTDSTEFPFILLLQNEGKPNHQILAYSPESSTFIDKLDHYSENLPATKQQAEEGIFYQPEVLNISTEDLNRDGLADINFFGQKLDKSGKKHFVRYVFLYIKSKDIFLYDPHFDTAKAE